MIMMGFSARNFSLCDSGGRQNFRCIVLWALVSIGTPNLSTYFSPPCTSVQGGQTVRDMVRPLCRALNTGRHICLHHIGSQRYLSAAANAAPRLSQSYLEPHHDADLRKIFDSEAFWKDFSNHGFSPLARRGARKGLFRNRFLAEPKGFLRFAEDTQLLGQELVKKILRASAKEEFKELPRQFDELSDALCRVLDAADFVRLVHPDYRYQHAATQAYAKLWEYMNVLNTTPGLHAQLEKGVSDPELSSTWTEEEMTVAKILLRDFSVSAINLPQDQRELFVDLSNDVKTLGHDFAEQMRPESNYVELDRHELKGLDASIVAKHSVGTGRVAFPAVGTDAHKALSTVQNAEVRRRIYTAGRRGLDSQIAILERLLETRACLARLSDFKSYAAMSLSDKLAGSPEAVDSFLNALVSDNGIHLRKELAKFQELQSREISSAGINAWDVLYYQALKNHQMRSTSRMPDFIAAYFSLGTVMQGLSRLFDRLYGVRLVPRQTAPGETWESGVRRLDVIHETEGHVATLYCDLFARPGKAPNPAHFTLRCSRRVWPSEPGSERPPVEDGVTVSRPDGSIYQIPTIALVCDFEHPPNAHTPTLLPFRDVQTLFHEMGHAIHSILGRTSLQVVSGTRCPTDFAELPSVLMESFSSDPSVLDLFARHWETDAPLPYKLVSEALEVQKRWQGIQTDAQIINSLVDQAYHSPLISSMENPHETDPETRKTTRIYHSIVGEFSPIREPANTTPQAFFSHLVEYGGLYYSYLFDRAIAGKIWREVFRGGQERGAIDRAAGERYKDEVLKWGGGRNGWKCISGVLGGERNGFGHLAEGGEEAMREVGKWGVHD